MNIFINYRREDSAYQADRLCELLSKYLQKPKKQLYIDTESTALGVNYIKVISDKISQCDVMLTLIGDEWLTLTKPNSDVSRIHEEGDLVCKEIDTALEAEKNIVPTMFDGATYLKESELPEPIKNLAWRNGISINRETFEEDVHRLAEGLGLTKDNRKYGVFIASQAPLLGYIVADQVNENKKKSEHQPPSRPPIFPKSAAQDSGDSSWTKGGFKPFAKLGAVLGLSVLALLIWFFLGNKVDPRVTLSAKSGQEVAVGKPVTISGVLSNAGGGVIKSPTIVVTRSAVNDPQPRQNQNQSNEAAIFPFRFDCPHDVKKGKPCAFELPAFVLEENMLNGNSLAIEAQVSSPSLKSWIKQPYVITLPEPSTGEPEESQPIFSLNISPKSGVKAGDTVKVTYKFENLGAKPIKAVNILFPLQSNTLPCRNITPRTPCGATINLRVQENMIKNNQLRVEMTAKGDFEGGAIKKRVSIPIEVIEVIEVSDGLISVNVEAKMVAGFDFVLVQSHGKDIKYLHSDGGNFETHQIDPAVFEFKIETSKQKLSSCKLNFITWQKQVSDAQKKAFQTNGKSLDETYTPGLTGVLLGQKLAASTSKYFKGYKSKLKADFKEGRPGNTAQMSEILESRMPYERVMDFRNPLEGGKDRKSYDFVKVIGEHNVDFKWMSLSGSWGDPRYYIYELPCSALVN